MLMDRSLSEPQLDFWHEAELGGASFVRARYPAHEFERHVHDELVIAVTEDGAGRCRAPRVLDTAGPGSLWISGVGEYHCGEVSQDQHWHYRAIYFDESALRAVSNVFQDDADDVMLVAPGVYFDPQIARLLISVHRKLEAGVPLVERQALWWSAMGLLFGRYGEPRPEIDPRGTERTKMTVAREYIAANYLTDISIDDLAAITGLSRHYFIRSFRREFGLPPHAYVNQLRLIAAKQILASGEPPADVAAAVGFYDQSHLNRLFKRTYGITPGTYAAAFCSS